MASNFNRLHIALRAMLTGMRPQRRLKCGNLLVKLSKFLSNLLPYMKEEIKSKSLMQKSWQLDKYWLNSDSFNVNWQALFCDSFHATQQLPRIVLICSVHTFNPVMTQAMWAILQYLYQPLKSCWMNRQRFKLPRNCLFV